MNTKLIENMKKKKKKGFTLIELIIVIAILAILAALALPKFGAVKETANISADKATAKNIETTIAKLIAEDKIDVSAPVATTTVSSSEIVGQTIDGDVTPKLKKYIGGHFTYSVAKGGDVTVQAVDSSNANAVTIFPTPQGAYAAS